MIEKNKRNDAINILTQLAKTYVYTLLIHWHMMTAEEKIAADNKYFQKVFWI